MQSYEKMINFSILIVRYQVLILHFSFDVTFFIRNFAKILPFHQRMKKLVLSLVAVATMAACSEQTPFNYRGLAFSMPVSQFVDSMTARGFAVDSAASDSGRTVVFAKATEKYRVLAAFDGDKLQAVQETYQLSTNDSTRNMWQEIRDGLEKELDAWPNCPMLKDDHKIANFDTGDGLIAVILENTYKPTLTVRYSPKKGK